MGLVDLRGRETDPEVCALLEADGAWSLVGWSRDGTLVACAGMERVDGDEIAVRALAAPDDQNATSLLDAIVGVATGARIVAARGWLARGRLARGRLHCRSGAATAR